MKTHQASFVLASDLTKGLKRFWSDFCDSEPSFSWGDNNRSLVTAKAILDHCDNTESLADHRSLRLLRLRVAKLPEGQQTYVDLEN